MRVLTTNDPVMEPDGDLIKLGDLGSEYTLPKASANTLGGIKVGDNLNIDEDGTLNADGADPYTLPAATAETLGGVKIGEGVTVEEDGTISVSGGGGGGGVEVLSLTPAANVVTALSGYDKGYTNICLKIGDYIICDLNGYLTGLSSAGAYQLLFTLPAGYTFTGDGTYTKVDSNALIFESDQSMVDAKRTYGLLSDNRIRIYCDNTAAHFSLKFIAKVTYTEV